MKQEWQTPSGEVIRYWTYNDDKKPTIFMVHGITGTHDGFQYLIPLLNDYRIIVPDLPGFGESTLNPQDYNVEGIAKLTNQLVNKLNLQRPYLVGHSMGGLIAAAMLEQNKDTFNQKVVLISAVATPVTFADTRKIGSLLGSLHYRLGENLPVVGKKLVKSKLISKTLTKFMITTSDKSLQNDITNHHYGNLNYVSSIKLYRMLHEEISGRGTIEFAEKLNKYDFMIISGDKDNVVPIKTEKELAQALNAKLVVIKNIGHLAHYETPELIVKNLRDFLK
jgi:pimeloyl-ACP methyl ester carboxylesterase